MTDGKDAKRRPAMLPKLSLVLAAVLLGALTGVGVAWFSGAFEREIEIAATPVAAECPDPGARVAAIKPFLKGDVAAMAPRSEPYSVASLAFNGPDGEALTLSDLDGQTRLVNLWATWCVPCREEMPALDELQSDMGGDDFEVVAINIDTGGDEKPTKFLNEIGVSSLGFFRDSSMGVFNTLKREGLAFGLPVTLLVDEKGCLLASMNGPAEWAGQDARNLVDAAIASAKQSGS